MRLLAFLRSFSSQHHQHHQHAAAISVNPFTEHVASSFHRMDAAVVDAVLNKSVDGSHWLSQTISITERAQLIHRLANHVESSAKSLALLATEEMGKPIKQAEGEVLKCVSALRFFADTAPNYLVDRQVTHEARIVRFPVGPILAILPFNFPYWQFFRFAAPALMAGNSVLLKHAPSTPRCAIAIERVFRETGFHEGVVQNLFVDPAAGDVERLIHDDRVRAVTLTGSTTAGAAVASIAGKAVKKCVLELGGSDPFIVLEDADLDWAVQQALIGRLQNAGQSCIASKRFLVADSVYDAFTSKLLAAIAGLTVGDPMDPKTDMGPMARRDLRDNLHVQVQEAKLHAKLLIGGDVSLDRGWFYPVTVLGDVQPQSLAFREELFGPVFSIIRVKAPSVAQLDDEMVRVANASKYGLAASVFSRHTERAEKIARRLDSGMAFVNVFPRSDPKLPFSGVKQSGFGTECSIFALDEFTVKKTFWIQDSPAPAHASR